LFQYGHLLLPSSVQRLGGEGGETWEQELQSNTADGCEDSERQGKERNWIGGKEGEGKGKASPYSTILCLSDGGRSWTDLGNGDLDDLEPSPQWLKW